MEKRNIIERFFNWFTPETRNLQTAYTNNLGLPYSIASTPTAVQTSLQLSAVYRCVETISDAIASQEFRIYELGKAGWVHKEAHPVDYVLNISPNKSMTRFSLMKTLIAKVLLEGNGYVIIHRTPTGEPEELELVNESVRIFRNSDGSLYYKVGNAQAEENGGVRVVSGEDMIHILNFSFNGLIGESTLTYASRSLSLSNSTELSASGFFSSGANMSGILNKAGKLTKEQAVDIKKAWSDVFSAEGGTPGGVAVLEEGLNFQPITVNPKDAQMLEIRQFNVIDICRFFGVHPSKVFDQSNLTYSNIESFQLGFLTDTISPLNSKIEAEFNKKLLRPSQRRKSRIELDIEILLRANMDAKANYIQKMVQVGGYTINEVRELNGKPKYDDENANKPLVQVQLMPIDKLGNKEVKLDNNIKAGSKKDNAEDVKQLKSKINEESK